MRLAGSAPVPGAWRTSDADQVYCGLAMHRTRRKVIIVMEVPWTEEAATYRRQ